MPDLGLELDGSTRLQGNRAPDRMLLVQREVKLKAGRYALGSEILGFAHPHA